MFWRVNGFPLPIEDATPKLTHDQHGAAGPAVRNRPTRRRRGIPRRWIGTTGLFSEEEADSMEGLIEGHGHHFPFDDDAASTAGLNLEAGGSFTITTPGDDPPRFGRGYLQVDGSSITWDARLIDGKHTISYWRATLPDWEQVVVRADGAKWLAGVRNDALVTTELVVSGGAMALDNSFDGYDDLVIMPFLADQDAIEAWYRWLTGVEMKAYWPLDSNALDITRDPNGSGVFHNGTPTGVTFVEQGGLVSGAAVFTGGADEISVPTDDELEVEAQTTSFAVEIWITIDSTQVTRNLINKLNTAAFNRGWRLTLDASGIPEFRINTSVFLSFVRLTGTVAPTVDTPVYIVGTYNVDTMLMALYVDGVVAASVTLPAGFLNPTLSTEELLIGSSKLGHDAIDGLVHEARFHKGAALSADEVKHRHRCGLAGRRVGIPRAFSDLPNLELDGELVDCEQVTVLGLMSEDGYTQHGELAGTATGWVNNARRQGIALDELKAPERLRLPVPYSGWRLASDHLTPAPASSSLRPSHGPPADVATNSGLTVSRNGPFGFGEAWEADNTAADRLDLPSSVAQGIFGAPALTVLAWVNRDVLGSEDAVINLSISGANSRLLLSVRSTNVIRLGGRSVASDSFENDEIAFTTVGQWALIGGVLDFTADEVQISIDGVLQVVQAVAFGQDTASDEVGTNQRIGNDVSLTTPWDGLLASVYLWRRRLTAAEHLRVYRLGLRGVFR